MTVTVNFPAKANSLDLQAVANVWPRAKRLGAISYRIAEHPHYPAVPSLLVSFRAGHSRHYESTAHFVDSIEREEHARLGKGWGACLVQLLPDDGSGVEASRLMALPGVWPSMAMAQTAALDALRRSTDASIVGFTTRHCDVDTHREHLARRAKAKRQEMKSCN